MHLVVNAFFWNQPHTGSGQYVRQLVSWLDRLVSDLKITLVVPAGPEKSDLEQLPEKVSVLEKQIRPGHLGKVYFEQIVFPRECRSLGADLAHVPYWGAPLQSSLPLVVTVHDVTPLIVREYRRGLKARLYTALVSASARSAGHIITDSNFSTGDIKHHLAIDDAGITTIYLAAAPECKPESDFLMDMAITKKYKLPEEYVLYLGGYEIHKNLETLLRAYTFVNEAVGQEIPLVLAGNKPAQPGNRFPDYDKHIAEVGLKESVHWTGTIDEADKPSIYRGAKSFAFPSKYEGFGLPPLEAMACGIPVVASNSSSLPEVIGSAGFTIDPDDYRQFGGSIIATLVQEELAAEMRHKGLEQAAKFSWEKTATETLAVYDSLVSGK
jgi:glycosyltransferase involved in cell wall biosynthesis